MSMNGRRGHPAQADFHLGHKDVPPIPTSLDVGSEHSVPALFCTSQLTLSVGWEQVLRRRNVLKVQ